MEKTIRVIAEGRGQSFARHTVKTKTRDDVVLRVVGQMEPCKLALAPIGVNGDDWPVVLWPDGTGEIALAFESKNENGQWERWDLGKLAMGGNVQ